MENDVMRLNPDIGFAGCMNPMSSGKYVLFTDYEALKRERDELREALTTLARVAKWACEDNKIDSIDVFIAKAESVIAKGAEQ